MKLLSKPRLATQDYQEAARIFLELCHQSISPEVSNDHVREMLIQHILTKDIFLRVFDEDQFHRENSVARQLDALGAYFLHWRRATPGHRPVAFLLRCHRSCC